MELTRRHDFQSPDMMVLILRLPVYATWSHEQKFAEQPCQIIPLLKMVLFFDSVCSKYKKFVVIENLVLARVMYRSIVQGIFFILYMNNVGDILWHEYVIFAEKAR
jgi:hypothetical protein